MRRVAILSVCVLLGLAGMVQATPLTTTYTGPVSFTATEDTSHAAYDLVTITINGFPTTDTGDKLTLVSGQWSALGPAGTGFFLDSSSTDDTVVGAMTSYINFASNTDTLRDGLTPNFTVPTGTGVYSAFGDSWYTSKTSSICPLVNRLRCWK